jgi:tRNA A-37 threonylcarbamoyl transferase component Bud32
MGRTPQPNRASPGHAAGSEPSHVAGDQSGQSTDDEPNDVEQVRIDELLDEWEATYEAGSPVPVETLCQNEPELIPEIRQRVAALQAVDRKLAKRRKTSRKTLPELELGALIRDLEFLSAGGLGEVYVGQDECLHRRVAVKFMHAHISEQDERRSQFALEAEITGRLEHPGVVPLYGFGRTADNRPFYAMRYIEGATLDQAIKGYFESLDSAKDPSDSSAENRSGKYTAELEFRRLLGSFVSVCKTIAYAHNRGVVHRDVKPSNIMIGRFGETIVVDWGLAVSVMRDERFRSSGEDTLALSPSGSQSGSASGRGSGTPAFMSPEQFSEMAPTPANDIYSLGATLFMLLCGKPPIRNKAISDIRNDRIEGKLPELNEIRKGIPRQLQAIAYKAMEKDAKDRYPTALDLAKDVERYLADEPVSACQDSVGLRVMRVARRHRMAAQAAVLGLVGCLLIAGLSAVLMGGLANRAEKLRDRNLDTSAQFIARACGYEIDRIWRVLEFEAQATQLRELVAAANQTIGSGEPVNMGNQAQLHEWLETRLLVQSEVPTIQKMFVLSMNGTQVARVPIPSEPQVGDNFRYRNYFTGLGFDLDPDSRLANMINEPLVGPKVYPSGVHMSSAYMSTLIDEQHLKVTFTVPIFSTDSNDVAETIGLIGTSVEVGEVMAATQIDDSHTWIADLRQDMVDGRPRRGLLLHYPSSATRSEPITMERLSSDLVEELLDTEFDYDETLTEDWLTGVSDHNSIQPVVINGRSQQPFDLGWVVITAESER